jgi:Uma2 family endonuclease
MLEAPPLEQKRHSPPLLADEFLARYQDSSRPVQLIDGEVVFLSMAKDLHQAIVTELMWLLLNIIKPGGLGELRTAPTDIYFDSLNYYQPDLFFVAKTNEACFLRTDNTWQGPPDLVIEILSPSTADYDRGPKFQTYERYGVREYWIIDPPAQSITVYQLSAEGQFVGQVYTGDSLLRSQVLADLHLAAGQLFPPQDS